MTDIDEVLTRVDELDAKATEGPWAWDVGNTSLLAASDDAGYSEVVLSADTNDDEWPPLLGGKADFDLIAAYRTDAPTLAAEVRRLRIRETELLAEIVRLKADAEPMAKGLLETAAEYEVAADYTSDGATKDAHRQRAEEMRRLAGIPGLNTLAEGGK